VKTDSSYCSASDRRVHFGLGTKNGCPPLSTGWWSRLKVLGKSAPVSVPTGDCQDIPVFGSIELAGDEFATPAQDRDQGHFRQSLAAKSPANSAKLDLCGSDTRSELAIPD
jgi:hypothetical protein